MLDENIYRRRIEEIRHLLERENADFALLTPSPNYQYLTGSAYQMHERLVALILTPEGDPWLIAPEFELSDHRRTTWIEEILTWDEDEDPYKMLADTIGEKQDGFNVFFDDNLPLGVFRRIEHALGGFVSYHSITPIIERMRLIKSADEIDLMRHAGKIIDGAMTRTFENSSIGMTELEIQQLIMSEISRAGGTQTFAIVQIDENSAIPHAQPGTTPLQKGSIILMDCGCSVAGYNTDMTRVGVVGHPSEEQKKIHSIVNNAIETATERIGPGIACGAADGFARKVIEDAGYGEFFTHRLGHGIGLEVHEHPYLVRGNPQVLEPGMTHSIEPGIYLEGKFGIRLEDVSLITNEGIELLTYTPRDLFIISS